MLNIENNVLSVNIKSKGAELDSIFHKQHQLEYLWNGDPAVWGKKSPILFPIVGTLKNDTYTYEDKLYHLSRHGFARESEFELVNQSASSLSLSLKSNASTLENYPFAFELVVTYSLDQHYLGVTYTVKNEDEKTMLFSVGGHPAFKVPLVAGLAYEDYFLEFGTKETAGRWPISPEGLIDEPPVNVLDHENQLFLTKELFSKDALVFKNLLSDRVSLKTAKNQHGLTFYYPCFPFLGIWAAKNADFVCIEPWCGIADSVHSNQQLTDKEGIEALEPGERFERQWKVELF